jgi:multiple RNA-binding domain-containing protein 1
LQSNAVLDSVAARFGVDKAEILQSHSTSAAARLALAETHLIQETKDYLQSVIAIYFLLPLQSTELLP